MLPIVKTYKTLAAGYSAAIAELRPTMEQAFKFISDTGKEVQPIVKKNIESFPDRLRENLTNFIANSATAVLTQDAKERQRAIQAVMQNMPVMAGTKKVIGREVLERKQLKKSLKGMKTEEIVPEEITAAPAPKKFPSDSAVLRRRSVKRVK